MEGFTYQWDERGARLETYEWDNVWWEHTEDRQAPRALIVGDSISCGYRGKVNELLAGEVRADGFGTSKAADNPAFPAALELFLAQQGHTEYLLVNNGLHGWHLSEEEYAVHYARLADFLRGKRPEAKMLLLLTTPVRDRACLERFDARNERVIGRNKQAREIAGARGIEVIDLYGLLENRPELYSPDGVHLRAEGYALLAGRIARAIRGETLAQGAIEVV